MTDLREKVANERRRLKQVRQALSAAIQEGAGEDPAFVPYYIAIANYIEASMGRLHIQDVRMGEMLRERVPAEKQAALSELDRRLGGNQQHLKTFLSARDALDSDGVSAIGIFEAASQAYTDYIKSQMGHHGGSTDLAGEYLTQEDWDFMAHTSDEAMANEQDLFDKVFAIQPDSVKGKIAS